MGLGLDQPFGDRLGPCGQAGAGFAGCGRGGFRCPCGPVGLGRQAFRHRKGVTGGLAPGLGDGQGVEQG